jgi:hypothetical protein
MQGGEGTLPRTQSASAVSSQQSGRGIMHGYNIVYELNMTDTFDRIGCKGAASR